LLLGNEISITKEADLMSMVSRLRKCVFVLLVLVALLSLAVPAVAGDPQFGGTLVVAMPAEPANLDMQGSTLNYIRYIAWHFFETLFTLDKDFQPIPMLASGYTVSEDGRTYTITLRENILFHNGKELTSEDAVASVKRAVDRGKMLGSFNILDVRSAGRYALEIELAEPMGLLINALAASRTSVTIHPKEVIEEAGNDGIITDYTGTGPFKFVEWRRGQHVLLERFEDYVPREEAPNGYGGARVPYLDQIKFMFVTEPSVRAVGLAAGDFDLAWPLTPDDRDRLESDPAVDIFTSAPWMYSLIFSNASSGLGGQRDFRRALQAAVDCAEAMEGAVGDPGLYRLDPGIMWLETAWYTSIGSELYNQADPDKARQILDEMRYSGEPVKIVASATEEPLLSIALIVKQQLEDIGMTVDLQTFDVATTKQVLLDPERWDVSPLDSTFRNHPLMLYRISGGLPIGWENAGRDTLVKALWLEQDPGKAYEIWEAIQALYYLDVPIMKLGDFFDPIGVRTEVKGYANMPEFFFWNVWLED